MLCVYGVCGTCLFAKDKEKRKKDRGEKIQIMFVFVLPRNSMNNTNSVVSGNMLAIYACILRRTYE